MNKETIYIGDNFCQFREMEYTEQWKRTREKCNSASKITTGYPNNHGLICPLCNENFIVGQTAYLIMNNNKLFPNIVIHKSCIKTDLKSTAETLKFSYENFIKLLDENKAWL